MNQEEMQAYVERQSAIVTRILKADPGMPAVTAHIIAGDLMSAERATAEVAAGVPADRCVHMVGSYARWEWVLQMVAQGALPEQWFQDNICELWSGADPDDTNPAYLAVWRKAWLANGGVIRDGRPLPRAPKMDGYLRVFRGGPPGTALRTGFAWTTDPKVARKFADGAGVRIPVSGGVVIGGLIKPSQVFAYITGRGEAEVICDPRLVSHVKTGEPK